MTATTDPIVIDLPGKFDSFFSGSSVGQGVTSMEETGYEAAPATYKAYREARNIKRGKGYSLRLTIPAEDAVAVLSLLREYGDVCKTANADTAFGPTYDIDEKRSAYAEYQAGQTVIDRCDAALKSLEGTA